MLALIILPYPHPPFPIPPPFSFSFPPFPFSSLLFSLPFPFSFLFLLLRTLPSFLHFSPPSFSSPRPPASFRPSVAFPSPYSLPSSFPPLTAAAEGRLIDRHLRPVNPRKRRSFTNNHRQISRPTHKDAQRRTDTCRETDRHTQTHIQTYAFSVSQFVS